MSSSDADLADGGVPPADIAVSEGLVRGLLRSQHPDLAGLPLRHAATGWDNVTYRLGSELAVRVPRLAAAAPLITSEQTWLPWLAPGLPLPVPTPLRRGMPAAPFPWPWSVVPWTPGRTADREPPDAAQASVLGRFLASLHRPPPAGFPRNDYRGVPLTTRNETVAAKLDTLAGASTGLRVPTEAVWNVWREALKAPMDTAVTCIHGDLHPRNLVVDNGVLAAVIDWGDMTAGDPATDLACAWLLFPPAAHPGLWSAYGPVTAHTMARARGWAVFFGVVLLAGGLASDPGLARIGRSTLERACAARPAQA